MSRSADHDKPVAPGSWGGSSVRLLAPVPDRPLGPVGGLRRSAAADGDAGIPAVAERDLLCSCGSRAASVCGDCHRPVCASCGGGAAASCRACRRSPAGASGKAWPAAGPVPDTTDRIFDQFFAAMGAAGFPGTVGFYDPVGIEPTGRQRRQLQKAAARDQARRLSGACLPGDKQAADVLWAQIAERACGGRPTHHGWFVGTFRAEAPVGGSPARSGPATLVLLTDRSFALCEDVELKLMKPAPAGDHRAGCVRALIRIAANRNITLVGS